MTSIDDLRAALGMVKEALPYGLIEPYRAGFETTSQQVAAALSTSKDEVAILGAIEQAKEQGTTAINAHLDRISQVIDSASETW